MSKENVEIAKPAMDAYNRRDVGAIDDLFTPDFEVSSTLLDGAGDFHGREGVGMYFAEMRETWEELRVIAKECRDLDDRVLWLRRIDARGRDGGVPVDAALGVLFDFRDARISRLRTYLDHGDALRAAGLSE